ncbi:MAG: ABC transporter permease [Desulfobacteraceae bacterium]|nr:ABC transporter permease [Desulfobacteraceae bacterium]
MTGIPKIFDLLRVSIRQVARNRRRYIGVMLAISIGTCGFILILTVGRDVKYTLNRDLDLLGGATRIKVHFEGARSSRDRIPNPQWFRPRTIEAVRAIPGVEEISLASVKPLPAVSVVQGREHRFTLMGVDEAFWKVNSFLPVNGEFFDAGVMEGRQKVCVLGADLARLIFDSEEVAGRMLSIDRELYRIMGVLGGTGVGDRVNYAFVPLTTGSDRVQGLSRPQYIYVRCGSWDEVGAVASAIPRILQKHQPDENATLEVAWEQLKRVRRIAWWIETFIYISVAVILVLGGMGIWNGMMATVQARTREIGLKKAIGAEDRDILIQFLAEALFLSLGSALFGILLGRGAVVAVTRILGSPLSEDLFLIAVCVSIVFSLLLGIGAGFTPSLLASRKEVVSALRYE